MEGPRAGRRMGVVAATSGRGGSRCGITPGSGGRAPTDPVPVSPVPVSPFPRRCPCVPSRLGGCARLLRVLCPCLPALGGSGLC